MSARRVAVEPGHRPRSVLGLRDHGRVIVIRPLAEPDLDVADRVMRTAFGTFLGLPDPATMFGEAQYVRPRFAAEPDWAFAAELDGELVGSSFATRWGSFGFFGPISVREDLWDRGIASRLLAAAVDLFEQWQVRQAGLFTFAQSAKHVGLYQKFGFWPQHLTAVMTRPVAAPTADARYATYSALPDAQRSAVLGDCRAVTDAIYDGLDVAHEIRAIDQQALGDTVLLADGSGLVGFAACHCGAGEARRGTCFVKFAAVRPGQDAGDLFEALLDCCELMAGDRGLEEIVAGVNVARRDAYRRLIARGYRTLIQGVRMHRPDGPGYCRPDVYVLDDLR